MSLPKESPELEGLIDYISMAHCRIDALFAILEKREIVASQEQLENEALSIFQKNRETRRDAAISLINVYRLEGRV